MNTHTHETDYVVVNLEDYNRMRDWYEGRYDSKELESKRNKILKKQLDQVVKDKFPDAEYFYNIFNSEGWVRKDAVRLDDYAKETARADNNQIKYNTAKKWGWFMVALIVLEGLLLILT